MFLIKSPLTAVLRSLFGMIFNSKTMAIGVVTFVVLLVLAIVGIYAGVTVLVWNALLAPYLGAQQIMTISGAALFVLGVWFLGKIGGCLLGCGSLILFVTSSTATVVILDMRLDPTHLLVFAVFLYIFGMGSSSSSSSSSED